MPMKTHRATRLAEIDEEINSRPYGNIIYKVTEWESRTRKYWTQGHEVRTEHSKARAL